eukprot:6730826-Prymnesium_polylepis.1
MWADCASLCVYSVYTPAAAGWRYDSRAGCYRPFAQRHPCLQERPHDLERVRRRAARFCVDCAEPQRREPCFALAREQLLQGDAPPPASDGGGGDDRFWTAQATLSRGGKCRAPCPLVSSGGGGGTTDSSSSDGRGNDSAADGRRSPFGASASLFRGLLGSATGSAAPD